MFLAAECNKNVSLNAVGGKSSLVQAVYSIKFLFFSLKINVNFILYGVIYNYSISMWFYPKIFNKIESLERSVMELSVWEVSVWELFYAKMIQLGYGYKYCLSKISSKSYLRDSLANNYNTSPLLIEVIGLILIAINKMLKICLSNFVF